MTSTDEDSPNPYPYSPSEATALYDLRRIWGDRYIIGYTAGGSWRAARIGDVETAVSADTPEMLRREIQEDYSRWQLEARQHNEV